MVESKLTYVREPIEVLLKELSNIVNYKEDFIAQCCSIDSTIDTDLYQKQLKLMDKYINMYLDIINSIKNMLVNEICEVKGVTKEQFILGRDDID